ncbi:MAG: glycosyltransferase family 2 protein, partial [Limisphaerales bacterium]
MNYKSQTLTAVVITFNHADTIEATLDSVRWADEVIVLDRGSTDGTLDIAQRFSKNIQYHPGENHATLLNDAFGLAKCDWILYLEPGEWVEEMLRHEIDGLLLNSDPAIAAYAIPRKLYFDQTCIQAGGHYPNRQVRMFRRGQGRALPIPKNNELIEIDTGEIVKLDRAIAMRPNRTLSDLFASINE